MEVARSNYLPGDPRLIDNIMYELKSQGIFDNFRKECISDVDTKPAYQNLRQRVEGSVMGFLNTQQWSPAMNKNQVREMLRRTISESGFLETGVERIVDQVVNPKINSIFFPQVENTVYKFLGIEKPTENSYIRKTFFDTVVIKQEQNELLPNDLEAISPECEEEIIKNENLDEDKNNEIQKFEETKVDKNVSPPFEALEETTFPPQDESSAESHLSGISDLTSHDSNQSFGVLNKATDMEISNDGYQNSGDNILKETPIEVYPQPVKEKLEINEDSNYSKATSDVTDFTFNRNFENILEQANVKDCETANIPNNNVDSTKSPEDIKLKKLDSKHYSSEKSSEKHKVNSDKCKIREHKTEKEKKSDIQRDNKHKSRHSSSSKSSNDRDRNDKDKSSSKKSDSKFDKESKSEKSHSKHRHSSSSSHRSRDRGSQKNETKSKDPSRNKSPLKKDDDVVQNDVRTKELSDKDHSKKTTSENSVDKLKPKERSDRKDSVKKHSSNSKHSSEKSSHGSHSKSKNTSKSHSVSKDRNDEKGHSKHTDQTKTDDVTKKSKDEKSRKRDEKRHSISDKHSSSNKKDKRDKERKDTKKDDHHISKEKKFNRRSTDRDSSDGHSGTCSSSSSFADSNSSSQLQKVSEDSSKINSGSNSGDSGCSDPTEAITGVFINQEVSTQNSIINQFQHIQLIKPKFASNIFEARRLLKIRRKLAKLEKQHQMKLLSNSVSITFSPSTLNDKIEPGIQRENGANIKVPLHKDNIKKVSKRNKALNSSSIKKKQPKRQNNTKETLGTIPEEGSKGACVEPVEDNSYLQGSVISKESWDAIEAKLNSENILKINYNSYVEESEESDDVFPPKRNIPDDPSAIVNTEMDVSNNDAANESIGDEKANIEKDNQTLIVGDEKANTGEDQALIVSDEITNTEEDDQAPIVGDEITNTEENNQTLIVNQECKSTDICAPSNNATMQVPNKTNRTLEVNKNCLYLVPEVLPETQRYLTGVASKIKLLEAEIARRTRLLILHGEHQRNIKAEHDINKRLPKVELVDVNTDTEIVISPSKSAKNQIKNHQDVHNNNNSKRKLLQFDDVDEMNENLDNQSIKLNSAERVDKILKRKRLKLASQHVAEAAFSLPLSPADSDNSISSNEKKNNIKSSDRRARKQSYTSDDLYKPRLRFTSSRRRLATDGTPNTKN